MGMGLAFAMGLMGTGTIRGDDVPIGGVLEAEIMGASMPAVAGYIAGAASNGKILRLRFKGIGTSATFDASKCSFTVRRPGYNTSKVFSANNVEETLTVTGLYRLAYPNGSTKLVEVQGSDLDVYVAISKSVFVDDECLNVTVQAGFYGACVDHTQTVVTNSSTRAYEMPQVDNLAQPPIMRLGSDGLYVEWAVMHPAARAGQTVAAVDCYIVDDTANPGTANRLTQTASSMIASTLVTPYTPPVYGFTFPNSTGLTNGLGGMSVKVYPWIGNAPWDLADHGEARIIHTSVPKFWPVRIDSNDSYKTARAYVSHTGATIGSPTFTTGSLGAYNPGVTPAYATIAAAMAAGVTWNNSGSNRATPHNDADALEVVIPSGTQTAGFGGNLQSYPGSGAGPLPRITIEAGADKTTTGIGQTATTANRQYRHLDADGCGLFPGAGAAFSIFDGNAASSSEPASLAAANMLVVRNCYANPGFTSAAAMIYRAGYVWHANNNFGGGAGAFAANYTLRQASVIHGGTYDGSLSATPFGQTVLPRVIGSFMRQVYPFAESARTFEYEVGQFIGWNRFEWTGGSGVNPRLGSDRAAIGARGMAIVGNLFRSCNSTAPALQIHADYAFGNDRPGMVNVTVMGNTIIGNRYNRAYLEAGDNTAIKEMYEYFNAISQINVKGDYMDPDGGGALLPSGFRTGNFALRFGTDKGHNRVAQTSSNSSSYSESSWLGDAAAPGEVNNIGNANMVVSDTSNTGTNVFANAGDYKPQSALQNAIPAGMAPWRNDLTGALIPNDGTGAAGAYQA